MKHSPEMQRIIDRMRPGILSLHGFLGEDRRPLEEILDADASTVAGLGTTHGELARKLADVLERAREGFGTTVAIDDRLAASLLEVKGRIPCPWGDGTFCKGEVTLADAEAGEKLVFTPLSVHMIAEHGFCEGCGSPYRLEPADIHRIFRMGATGKDPL